jgi:hypothetical protein
VRDVSEPGPAPGAVEKEIPLVPELRDLGVSYALARPVAEAREYLFRRSGSGGAGVATRAGKELPGHEDIKSTILYTEVTDATLSVAVLRLPFRLAGGPREDPR